MADYRTTVTKIGIELTPDWRSIRKWICPVAGNYLILYRCKAINNMRYNVLVSFRMRLNDAKTLMQGGWNISWDNHYGNFTLHHLESLAVGDVIGIEARADSEVGMPDKAVVIPFEGTQHEELTVIQIADGLTTYKSESLS